MVVPVILLLLPYSVRIRMIDLGVRRTKLLPWPSMTRASVPASARTATARSRCSWRHQLGDPQGSRGRKPRLTVDEVVNAAIALADEDGLDALSIRRAGGRAPRCRHHDDLHLRGVEEPARGADARPGHRTAPAARTRRAPGASAWRARRTTSSRAACATRGCCRSTRRARHSGREPPTGDEYALAPLDGIGLTDLEMDAACATLAALVESTGPQPRSPPTRRARTSGQTDEEWWETNSASARAGA